jgi:hypothetical protein
MSENDGLLTADNPVADSTADWRDGVSRETRFSADGNDKLARFTDATSMANSYLEMEKMNSGRVNVPTADSTPEEVSAFYQKLPESYRAPETAEGYGALDGASETEKEYYGAMASSALKGNMPAGQFQGLVAAHNEFQEARANAETNATEEALQSEWAGDYAKNIEIVERVFRDTEGGTEFKEWFNSVGGGRNEKALKWLLDQGKATMDDTFVKGDPVPPAPSDYVPKYVNSPSMYKNDDTEDGVKARAYFASKGIEI